MSGIITRNWIVQTYPRRTLKRIDWNLKIADYTVRLNDQQVELLKNNLLKSLNTEFTNSSKEVK
jgi:hypothetical protein